MKKRRPLSEERKADLATIITALLILGILIAIGYALT